MPSKRQTRRAISVKGITYARLKAYCDEQARAISNLVEELINEKLDEAGVQVPTELPESYPKRRKEAEPSHSGHWTF
jgi:hypothetical protein